DRLTRLPVTIRFQGQTYTVGVPTTAELDWHLTRIGYEWDAVSSTRGFLGAVFDLKDNKMNAKGSAPGVTAEIFEHTIPVPTVGGIGRGYLGQYISFTAELTGFKVNRSDFVAKFFDFDLYGTANFGRNFCAQYGYRRVTLHYDDDNHTRDGRL